MHKPMDNKNNSSRLIISIVSRLHLWLCSCPAELVPASTTVIRARKNKKTKTNKKKNSWFLLLHSTMYVKCLISLSFDCYFLFLLSFFYASMPRLVSYRHVVTRPLGNGSVIEGGFDIESCNGIAWKRINAKLPDFHPLPRSSNSNKRQRSEFTVPTGSSQ
jgi:hypothetical protein